MNRFGLDIYRETWGVANNFDTLLMHRNLLLGSSIGKVMELLGLLFLFCLILACAVFATKLVGNKAMGYKNNNIKIIETYRLSTNCAIQIVRIAGKYFAMSVSKEKISVLTELDEDNVIIPQQQGDTCGVDFNEILKKAKKKIKDCSKKG